MIVRRGVRPGVRQVVLFSLLALGLQQMGSAVLIKAKALLAPVLIDQAWQHTLEAGGGMYRPWPWADTWPVARLRVPSQGIDLPVLQGDSGNALAFAPGRAVASAPIGAQGTVVIAGHRDTHFRFLQHVSKGDIVQLQLPEGEWRGYRITSLKVVDASQEQLYTAVGAEQVMLVTCYPFDAIRPGGPLRYVVLATPVPATGRA